MKLELTWNFFSVVRIKEAEVVETQVLLTKDDYM